MTSCRSCGAEVAWALTSTGKRMPVDAEPVPDGNVTLSLGAEPHGTYRALVWGPQEDPPAGLTRYTSHFATCPHANQHRRTR